MINVTKIIALNSTISTALIHVSKRGTYIEFPIKRSEIGRTCKDPCRSPDRLNAE